MRIIAGQYKGRDILAPEGRQITRPITGLAKKSLFGMLGEDLTGQHVLDLFCGTGTLGIEALSRGASHCRFADRHRGALDLLRQNLQMLGCQDRATLWAGDVAQRLSGWLATLSTPVDVAFVDPPYAHAREWDWPRIAETLFTPLAQRLADDGTVVLRVPDDATPPESLGGLAIGRTRKFGNMVIHLLHRPGEVTLDGLKGRWE